MAELPHMPMFWGDYLGDTTHLTCLEHGAYLQLIGKYWRQGHGFPDDDARLCRLVGLSKREWKAVREIIVEFFIIIDGVWQHKRIEQELAKARRKVEQASEAGRASAQRRFNGRSTDAQRESNGRDTGKQPTRTRTIKNPLTPLRDQSTGRASPSGGRASEAGEARQIGDVLKGRD